MLKLYNTLTRKIETFKPLEKNKVKMYSCGPTVYNYAHIGNLRTYIFNDLLKKSLELLDYKVTHVMNITDVDDKTIKGSHKENESLSSFTKKYEKIFFADLEELNISKPTYVLRATESVQNMITLIETLLKKKYAYKTSDGIYFSIEKAKGYGKLAQLEKIKSKKERISSDEYDKNNAQDFALWKFHSPEDGEVFWQAPFGKGRPGWHIECSAMSMKILGETLDIHTGAIDLIFPHHTNEIAQSECATGKQFVKYWLHGGFLTMKEGKMSKSLGNVFYLKDLEQKGFSPLDYRYLCLSTHYRDSLNFNIENLESAKNSLKRLKNIISEIKDDKNTNEKYLKEFKKALENDLNTPEALQVLWKLIRDKKAKGKLQTIAEFDKVLSLDLLKKEKVEIPEEISQLLKQREQARKDKNFSLSDQIRDKIGNLGYKVSDSKDGQKIEKN